MIFEMNCNNLFVFVKIGLRNLQNPIRFDRNMRYFYTVCLHPVNFQCSSPSRVAPKTFCLLTKNCDDLLVSKGSVRFKSKDRGKGRKAFRSNVGLEVENEDENEEWEEQEDADEPGKDYKDILTNVGSMRLDNILKAGLGISKNKIEIAFYESKLRLNGNKVLKKSISVKLGDEADLVLGVNAKNENFLDVSRVVIRGVLDYTQSEHTRVKLRRYKRLTIQNYTERWKKIEAEGS